MSAGRKLGPPRGADDTRAALLASRFTAPAASAPAEDAPAVAATEAPTDGPVEAAAEPETARPSRRSPTAATKTRTPDGMTRRTYYVARDVARDLDAAVDQVVAGAGGLVSRHQALAAILAAGVRHTDDVLADVRTQLMTQLGTTSST